MADPAELQKELQAAIEQTLQSSLEAVTRELHELVAAVQAVGKHATSGSGFSSVIAAIQPLVQAQARAAAVSASIDAISRFVALSLQMSAAPMVVAAPVVEAPAAIREAAPPPPEVAPPPAPVVEAAPPPPPPPPAAPPKVTFDVESLSAERREVHKKAKRFARVSVQEMVMYKPKEVEAGRQKKDLYQRFQEEIDKGRATYEKRFAEISGDPVDYFYEELVHQLANNDPSALGNYPYPVPSRQS